jgi:hypothetical protein
LQPLNVTNSCCASANSAFFHDPSLIFIINHTP